MATTFRIYSIFAISLILSFCFTVSAQAKQSPREFNVILIDITALRADHISFFGYKRPITPHIDQFARESVVFTQAISQAHWTLPSVTSVLTSLYVPSHSVDSRTMQVPREIPGVPAVLKDNGYRTLAFVGGLDLVAKYNLSQYFEFYNDNPDAIPMGSLKEGFSQAIEWIRSNSGEKFFMFLQGYDVHPPFKFTHGYKQFTGKEYMGAFRGMELNYQVLKNIKDFRLKINGKDTELTQDDIDYVIAAYDASIKHVDKLFGDFIRSLRDSGKMDNTIVILFGDHGEELHDHGTFDRFGSKNYFDEVLRVPLIIHHPLLKHKIINSQVELIDIMPTVLGFLELVPKASYLIEGRNLISLINGSAHSGFKKYVYSGGLDGQYAVRMKDWKLIFLDKKFKLYNLNENPNESTVEQNDPVSTELAKQLYDWYLTTSVERFRRNTIKRLPHNILPLQFRDPGPELWNR